MRSTLEIIIAVKECQPVTEEELKLALMVMSSIDHFLESELRDLAEAVESGGASAKLRAGFAKGTLERMFAARKKAPDEWLGPGNIPGNPEHDRRLVTAKKLYEKATGQKL
jgi:hypothetical protein